MKHPERVQQYLEHIAQSLDRATTYAQYLIFRFADGQVSDVDFVDYH